MKMNVEEGGAIAQSPRATRVRIRFRVGTSRARQNAAVIALALLIQGMAIDLCAAPVDLALPKMDYAPSSAIKSSEINGSLDTLYQNDVAMNGQLFWGAVTGGIGYGTGNVGIGPISSSPAERLVVNGNVALENWGQGYYIGHSPTMAGIKMPLDSSDLALIAGAAEIMRIKDTGYIGIGTSTPISQLHLSGNAGTGAPTAGTGTLFLQDPTGLAGNGGAIVFGGSPNQNMFFAGIKGFIRDGSSNTVGDLAFYTRHAVGDASLTERMRIANNGNVGIGTTSPTAKLHVEGPVEFGVTSRAALTGGATQIWGESLFGGHLESFQWAVDVGTNASVRAMTILSTGNVGIGMTSPGYKLTVNGQPGCNGYTLFTNYSDSRLKEDVAPIDVALDRIMALEPVTFHYNERTGYDEATRKTTFSGFVAQELEKVFPGMVGKNVLNGEQYLDSNLSALPVYTVKALQELKEKHDAEIRALQGENAALRGELANLSERLARIESAMR